MAFDLKQLVDLVAQHGSVARVVIAEIKGSSPREVGAHMWVWRDGQAGTIGGGALEFQALKEARLKLDRPQSWTGVHPLGPELGQCCGGVVRLVSEVFDTTSMPTEMHGVFSRAIAARPDIKSIGVDRVLDRARARGEVPNPQWLDGYMIEPAARLGIPLWIWGAGHVGRALVQVLGPLPGFNVTWVDTGRDRFPKDLPEGIDILYGQSPDHYVGFAPSNAMHLILTYSHALDLALCDRVLQHGFQFAGLIGSKTKWARFRRRLADLGHSPTSISAITCPIGRPEFGKHPFEIAISVSTSLLEMQSAKTNKKERVV